MFTRPTLRRESRLFVIGSALFGAGAGGVLVVPAATSNLLYFVGSWFFTAAATVQLLLTHRPPVATRVDRYDWWSAAVQWAGTLAFNVSTGFALVAGLTATEERNLVWRPDAVGSVCFLVSSALAVVATTDTDALWDPHARNWRSTWLNMLGSLAFGASAVGAHVDPAGATFAPRLADLGTFVGALCFLVAALSMRPADPPDPHRT
ncbi:YrhK family protein [Rhodococcus sp. GXMU-t2271]|uniref:YrhK family protein n=1 Tax=Rhodococcus indonesiensis TaxID=3055869 RepID=A0ABT7RG89_9NOCA|nr:YrhK family protein [Rhodococcus indonesiensis]MDM7486668.1 YrhK family protein [Rhodococcus indonesiensis]